MIEERFQLLFDLDLEETAMARTDWLSLTGIAQWKTCLHFFCECLLEVRRLRVKIVQEKD